MQYNILILMKDKYSDRFISATGDFFGYKSISEILSSYPLHYLMVMNVDLMSDSNLVIGRQQIIKLFEIDNKLQFVCKNCGKKNKVTRKVCRHCYFENKYYDIIKYLSDDACEEADINSYIHHEFIENEF